MFQKPKNIIWKFRKEFRLFTVFTDLDVFFHVYAELL